jgi:GNAT superfamily N-acetyltransferase
MNVSLRRGELRDHSFIVESQMAMAEESEGLKLSLSTLQKGVSRILENSEIGFYLIAEIDNKPSAMLLVLKEWSDWRNAWIYWIHSLFVNPAVRKQGVYRKMYEYLQNEVKSSSEVKGIRLYVDKKNITGQKTYQALGMNGEHYDLYEWMHSNT